MKTAPVASRSGAKVHRTTGDKISEAQIAAAVRLALESVDGKALIERWVAAVMPLLEQVLLSFDERLDRMEARLAALERPPGSPDSDLNDF